MRKGISWMIRVLGGSLLVLLALGSTGVNADFIDTVDITGEGAFGESGFSGLFVEHPGLGVCGGTHSVHVGDSKPGTGPNYCNPLANIDFIPGAGAWNASENGFGNRHPHWGGVEAHAVPEPGSLALLGIGLIGMGIVSRRRVP